MSTFAENLIGITIENNWTITEKILVDDKK